MLAAAAALGAAALTAAWAQAPGSTAAVTLKPSGQPGTVYTYSVTVHSQILRTAGPGMPQTATLDNTAEVEMRVLPPSAPGALDVQMRFTKDTTTVQAEPDLQSALEQEVQATDKAAMAMDPVHFRTSADGEFQTISRSTGDDYDQPVIVLDEIARADSLPVGPTNVGDHWTRARSQAIPTMHYSIPLTLQCALTAVGRVEGRQVATVTVHSHGDSQLPPGAIPDLNQLASQGVVPTASIEFTSDSTSQYTVPNAVLTYTASKSHNVLHLVLSASGQPSQSSDTTIDSTGSVKLDSTKTAQ